MAHVSTLEADETVLEARHGEYSITVGTQEGDIVAATVSVGTQVGDIVEATKRSQFVRSTLEKRELEELMVGI